MIVGKPWAIELRQTDSPALFLLISLGNPLASPQVVKSLASSRLSPLNVFPKVFGLGFVLMGEQ